MRSIVKDLRQVARLFLPFATIKQQTSKQVGKRGGVLGAMIGENRQLVTNEPVEFEK